MLSGALLHTKESVLAVRFLVTIYILALFSCLSVNAVPQAPPVTSAGAVNIREAITSSPALSPAPQNPKASSPESEGDSLFLKRARSAYYSLNAEGMTGFSCAVTPNWTSILKALGVTDPNIFEQSKKRLEQIHFTLTMDGSGHARVKHNDVPAENAELAKSLNLISDSVENTFIGFFDTWSPFVVYPPLPEPGTSFRLERGPTDYSITYQKGKMFVNSNLSKEYAITSQKVTEPDSESTLHPHFQKTGKGFLLDAYDSQSVARGGKDNTSLSASLEYQDVAGLKLPRTLKLSATVAGNSFRADFEFSACTATKR